MTDPYGQYPPNGPDPFGAQPQQPYPQQPYPQGQYPPGQYPTSAPPDPYASGYGQPYPPAQPYSAPPAQPYPNQSYPNQPYSAQPYSGPPAQPYSGVPAPAGYQQPYGVAAGWGVPAVDPVTGQPLSDKSKVVAGLLQLLLGGFAVGRFYTGHIGMAFAQLAVGWGVMILSICAGSLLIIPFLFAWVGFLWPLIDGIMLLVKGGTDAQGRVLRS